MTLSVIVPSRTGSVPESLRRWAASERDVELVVVAGVSPVGRARNEGLARATGAYVAWVDADDEILPEWGPRILEGMRQGWDVMTLDYVTSEGRSVVWHESGRGLLADVLDERIFCPCWLYVTRRELWDGLRFDESDAVAEDYRLMPEVVARVRSVGRLGCIYRYTTNPASLTHDYANRANMRARFHAGVERATRWQGTPFADVAFAASCRLAGWTYEWHGYDAEIGTYLKTNLRRAWKCADLAWHWKIKLVLVRLGLVRLLKPLYCVVHSVRACVVVTRVRSNGVVRDVLGESKRGTKA